MRDGQKILPVGAYQNALQGAVRLRETALFRGDYCRLVLIRMT